MGRSADDDRSINQDDATTLEIERIRRAVKIASFYGKREEGYKRNPNLSHLAHVGLHGAQLLIALSIEVFHLVHHKINRENREIDDTVPPLPEERNPVFFIYPLGMLLSLIFGAMWSFKKILPTRPLIALYGCGIAATAMLFAAIMEMVHVDKYIDITEVSDDEILHHPVFIHNFVMCLLSIFAMSIYLIQFWILYDLSREITLKSSTSSEETDISLTDSLTDSKSGSLSTTDERVAECENCVCSLDAILSWDALTTRNLEPHEKDVDKEPVILYCCFVDLWNHFLKKRDRQPLHEFQIIHIM